MLDAHEYSGVWTSQSPQVATRGLNVVIVDEELPYPPTSGKRIRTLNLTLRLARRHHITYVCHRNADAEEARRAAAYLAGHGIKAIAVDRAVPKKSGPAFYFRLAVNLTSPLPYSVAAHTSAALKQALREHAANHRIDLWHCEWTPYAEALRGLTAAPRLIIAHNVESLIWQRYHEVESNPFKRWFIKQQWRKFQRFERWAFTAADRVVAVSDEDARAIADQFGTRNLEVVENGVDTSSFRPIDLHRQSGQILFLGSLDWRPNLDAVRLLLEQVFPAVKTQEPSAHLCLVGRNPPKWLRRQIRAVVARSPDRAKGWWQGRETLPQQAVSLHADVADVRPYLARCGMLAVPLRIGGGSRLKILEALACGTPVVSTRIGAEGLHLEPGKHLVVVDRVEDMASALVSCIRDSETAQALAVRGRERVLERYDWDTLADKLEEVWIKSQRSEVKGQE
jgi:glycosyltransferase involved in cell wall biosynthesis